LDRVVGRTEYDPDPEHVQVGRVVLDRISTRISEPEGPELDPDPVAAERVILNRVLGRTADEIDACAVRGDRGDRAGGRALLEKGLAIYREQCDRIGIANSLNSLARAAYREDMPAARALAEESLAIGRGLGNQVTTAVSLMVLGWVAQ
jgi:hypothetical protein